MFLSLYRRHLKKCIKKYPQNHRILFPTRKTTRSKDCNCPIAAEGKLSIEGRITNRSTKTTDWESARAITKQWETWGMTSIPIQESKDVSIEYAVKSFLTSQGPQGRNVETNTYHGFEILLYQRLIPFAHSFSYVRTFDNLDVVSKFVESWINLQPTRNRKEENPGRIPLADSTKKTELERLRFFLTYCVDRGWLQNNYAKKIKLTYQTKKKFGLSPEEEKKIFDAIRSTELRVFCLVMRHSGLRISDTTTLDDTQLIIRASGEGWALKVYQKKTKEWVYIPIPSMVADELHALPIKGMKENRRYWFWTGKSNPKTTTNNWYAKLKKVVNTLNFSRSVSPHTFRHTFCISHLNAGVEIKFVSRWCGHKSITVTEKHYSHAIHGTLVASDFAHDESLKRQLVMTASMV